LEKKTTARQSAMIFDEMSIGNAVPIQKDEVFKSAGLDSEIADPSQPETAVGLPDMIDGQCGSLLKRAHTTLRCFAGAIIGDDDLFGGTALIQQSLENMG
jgi:hypothetical protein